MKDLKLRKELSWLMINNLDKLLNSKITFCPNVIGPCKFHLEDFCMLFGGGVNEYWLMQRCHDDKEKEKNEQDN